MQRRLEFALDGGSNWNPVTADPGSTTENFTSNNTWTTPAYVSTLAFIKGIGGGGAASGRATTNGRGGGGGGGAYAENTNIAVTPGTTHTIVVGIGGIGNSGNGNAGNNSSFTHNNGTVVMRAVGGTNGSNSAANGVGGAGGLAASCIGTTSFNGGTGGTANTTSSGGGGGAAGNLGIGANGSNTAGGVGNGVNPAAGNGGANRSSNGAGLVGNNYGGGGGGSFRTAGSPVGGNGANGFVQVIYTPLPPIVLHLSGNITGTQATTARLTTPGGTFVAGNISEANGVTSDANISGNNYTEDEWCIQAVSTRAANNDVYKFRVTANGIAYGTYTQTPKLTIGSGITGRNYTRLERAINPRGISRGMGSQ